MHTATNLICKLKKEHSIIIKKTTYFEKYLPRIGKNLLLVQKFLNLFDNKIIKTIKIEEQILFPHIEKQIAKDGSLFVMTYTHEIIENEFEKLRNALFEKNISNIQKSSNRLIQIIKYHIEKEDVFVLNETEKKPEL